MASKRPVIKSITDLQQYGLNCLTGEACAYGMRLLFDVNDDGKALLTKFFSCQAITFYPPMNSRVGALPSTGGIMLIRAVLAPLAEFIMYAIEDVDFVAIGSNFDFHGFMKTDEHQYSKEESIANTMEKAGYQIRYNWKKGSSQPSVGDRNVHAFTGRTV